MQPGYGGMPPVSRNSHPATSHRAELEIGRSGQRAKAMRAALAALRESPGLTSAELEQKYGVRDGHFRKRLSDLRALGFAETQTPKTCTVSGMKCQTWVPSAKKGQP
jgi:hypothetical protein